MKNDSQLGKPYSWQMALMVRCMNFLARNYPEFHELASQIVPHLPQIIDVSSSQPYVGTLVLILMLLVIKPTWTRNPDRNDL